MAWRPKLIVRFGSKGRGISSPTHDAGYLFQGSLAVFLASGLVAVAVSQAPFMLLALLLPGVLLRDVWAWFAATDEERAAFRHEVERLKARGWRPPPDQAVIGEGWAWKAIAGLLAGLALSIALVASAGPGFLIVTAFAAAVLAAVLLDRLRAWTRKHA